LCSAAMGSCGLQPEHSPVPVAVSALLRTKPDTVTARMINKMAGVYGLQLQGRQKWPRALELAKHVLANDPNSDYWLQQLQQGDPADQASEPDDAEDVIQGLSAVSLEELPPDEQKEFPREQARLRQVPGRVAHASAAQALRRQAGGFPEPSPEDEPAEPAGTHSDMALASIPLPLTDLGGNPAPPLSGAPGTDGDNPGGDPSGLRRPPTRRHWVNGLLPEKPPGTTSLVLYAPPGLDRWEGRYENPGFEGQKTASRSWGGNTNKTGTRPLWQF